MSEMSKSEPTSKLVSEVIKWYIVNEKITWLTEQQVCGETDILNVASNLSVEVGRIGQQCGEILQKMDFSDIVLLLGAGGVIAYLWKNSVQEETYGAENSRLKSTSFMNWLFGQQTYHNFSSTPKMVYRLEQTSDSFPLKDSSEANNLGLNLMSSSQKPRRFLKHRLFDISQLRDTSRFKNREKYSKSVHDSHRDSRHNDDSSGSKEETFSDQVSHSKEIQFSKRRYLPTAQLYGNDVRGTPDGEERCTPSPASKNSNSMDFEENALLNRASVNPKSFPISSSMREIMQNAKEVRRLIREASLDSQASDFFFDTPFIDVNSEKLEESQACQDEREESLPPLNMGQLDSRELLKLVGFSYSLDRESSTFSEFSDHWRNAMPHKVALGHSSSVSEFGDDVGSFVGSCLDHWEWDDECYFEGDFKCQDFEEDTLEMEDHNKAWLPDSEELDLEKELRLRNSSIYSSAYSSKEPSVSMDYQLIRRLPPSGRSSVESSSDLAASIETQEGVTKPAKAMDLKDI